MKQKLKAKKIWVTEDFNRRVKKEVERQRKPKYNPSINDSSVIRDLVAKHL